MPKNEPANLIAITSFVKADWVLVVLELVAWVLAETGDLCHQHSRCGHESAAVQVSLP
jgi:hypothetical protein